MFPLSDLQHLHDVTVAAHHRDQASRRQDNGAMERFFWSLKHEWTNHEQYANLEEARLSVFKYIETFYNPVRLHETLHYRSPDNFGRKRIAA